MKSKTKMGMRIPIPLKTEQVKEMKRIQTMTTNRVKPMRATETVMGMEMAITTVQVMIMAQSLNRPTNRMKQ